MTKLSIAGTAHTKTIANANTITVNITDGGVIGDATVIMAIANVKITDITTMVSIINIIIRINLINLFTSIIGKVMNRCGG